MKHILTETPTQYTPTTEELLSGGIINIDKPKGPSSHQTSDYTKKLLRSNKAGHSGTLDPAVTGVQPIAYGWATRIIEYFLTAPKTYVGVMHVHKPFTQDQLERTVAAFHGTIKQMPPVKSAVKRQVRDRNIYSLDINEVHGQDVLFTVTCQAGTYIRKLCHDMGKKMGTGAHMATLRRTKAGPVDEQDALVTLDDLRDAMKYHDEGNDSMLRSILHPIEIGVRHMPKVYIHDTALTSIKNGRDLARPGIIALDEFEQGDQVAVMTSDSRLIAVGVALKPFYEVINSSKGIVVRTNKVFFREVPQSSLPTQG